MGARRKKFGKCGHRGFGAACNRCVTGERLLAAAEREASPAKKAALLAEGQRLLGPAAARRQPVAVVAPVQSPESPPATDDSAVDLSDLPVLRGQKMVFTRRPAAF